MITIRTNIITEKFLNAYADPIPNKDFLAYHRDNIFKGL